MIDRQNAAIDIAFADPSGFNPIVSAAAIVADAAAERFDVDRIAFHLSIPSISLEIQQARVLHAAGELPILAVDKLE